MNATTLQETNNQRRDALAPRRETPYTRAERPLRLLSLDGGGIRGLSSLYILREIMQRVKVSIGADEVPLPCDYFDMICGTSTGGLIAIMLGKLRMSIEEAIASYANLSESIFGRKKRLWVLREGMFPEQTLEQAVAMIAGKRAQALGWPEAANSSPQPTEQEFEEIGRRVMMRGVNTDPECKVFVCTVNTMNVSAPAILRTYKVVQNELYDFAIWEAARATSAAPHFFKPMAVKPRPDIDRHFETVYIDGGLKFNNPINQLLKEASRQFPDRKVSLILSLGTGTRNTIKLPRAGVIPKLHWRSVFKLYQKIALNCEKNHRAVQSRFNSFPDVYFRFNVDAGMANIGLEEWTMLPQIEPNTRAYMERPEVNPLIQNAVESLLAEEAEMTIQQAAGL